MEKIESKKTVRAVPVKKLRIFSSSPIRLLISPTGLREKKFRGKRNK